MTMSPLFFSFAVVLLLLTLVLLSIPVVVAGVSNAIETEETKELPPVKVGKLERRLLKGRVDGGGPHHRHGDEAGSFKHAHHDTVNQLSKQKGGKDHHRHHEHSDDENSNNEGTVTDSDNEYNNQDLIMTVVSDGCGHVGKQQHCPPIDICAIKGVVDLSANAMEVDRPTRRVLGQGGSEEVHYLDIDSLADYDHDNDLDPDYASMDAMKMEAMAAENDHADGHEMIEETLPDRQPEEDILLGDKGGWGGGGGGGPNDGLLSDGGEGTGGIERSSVGIERHGVGDDVGTMEVGWDGVIVPSSALQIPTRRPTVKPSSTSKPSTRNPAGGAPIKTLASLPTVRPSTIAPHYNPTRKPVTRRPSRKPSFAPTPSCPSSQPTSEPTPEPTPDPSSAPTLPPTKPPTRPPVKVISPPTTPQINTANNLANHGGRVMTSTQTVAIFWGPKWAVSSFVSDKITGIDGFYQGYANSNYAAIVTQYAGSNGPISARSTYLGTTVDEEVLHQHTLLTHSMNTLYWHNLSKHLINTPDHHTLSHTDYNT